MKRTIHPYLPHPPIAYKSVNAGNGSMKALSILLALVAACALGTSCEHNPMPSVPPPIETKPIGEGLQVIGFAMLGASVVFVLGRLLRCPPGTITR